MKDFDHFIVSIEKHLAHVKFNRPKKSNALHEEAWQEMKDVFESLDTMREVRVIILTGEGKNFCAGIDLSLLMGLKGGEEETCEGRIRERLRAFIVHLQECISSIEKCSKPVIAGIHGACIGGGVDIISACDMRYCAGDAFFSIREVDMGLVADIGTLQRLPKIIHPGIMAELSFTGRNVYSDEAERIGLVNNVFQDKYEMEKKMIDVATTIAQKSPLVIRGIKEVLHYTRDHTVADSLDYVATYNAAFLISDDLKEAINSFMKKEAPKFKN